MYQIIIQQAAERVEAPSASSLQTWAETALRTEIDHAELTIRIVDTKEMTELNTTYRHKNGPTNVLAFPFTIPDEIPLDVPILGDIVICAEIVNREAKEQNKSQNAHWAHIIVHGTLHLLGYDHVLDQEAKEMESLEIEIMQHLGFANPYEAGEDIKHYD